jgi:uptake hydrogenase large subunit
MNAPLSAGAIGISIHLAQDTVCAVELRSQRPQTLSRLFEGRVPEEAGRLAGQIFSLCGFSQATAARLAVARAMSCPLAEEERMSFAAGLLAERIFETLRALVMQWPGKIPAAVQAATGLHLRNALRASRAIVAEAETGRVTAEALGPPAVALRDVLAGVGLRGHGETPAEGSLLNLLLRDVARDEVFTARPADTLGVEDDAEVARLLCEGETYAMWPFLPNRIMETGAYARHLSTAPVADRSLGRCKVLTERLVARISDLDAATAELQALSEGSQIAVSGLMNDGLSGSAGFGVVECARGRLYHSARIDGDGRLCYYRILAPTEWNFHPAGPFVETLLSARIGRGETARLRAAKLAALFDPCVAFDIDMKEAGRA